MAHSRSSSPSASTGRGRPRQFDIETALEGAARIFRERGYHATSIPDLTEAMELASGSVYKAFKDKRAVFLAAFDQEGRIRWEKLRQSMSTAKSGRDRLHTVLTFYAESSHGVEGRRGCFVVGTATEMATLDAEVAQRVSTALQRIERLIADVIREGQADGSISAGIDREATAGLLMCVLQGMRVVGKAGRRRTQMTAVADVALKLLG